MFIVYLECIFVTTTIIFLTWINFNYVFVLLVGHLSVDSGSHLFSDGVGRPNILRPLPIPCMPMSSLCYKVRGADCAYPSFCQPQLCCLHCRSAQSVSLEKRQLSSENYSVTCPQQPNCSSTSNLQRCHDPEDTTGLPQITANSSQNPTVPDLIQQKFSGTMFKESAISDQSQCEHNSTIPEPAALNSKQIDKLVSSTKQLLTCRNVTDLTTDQQSAEEQSSKLGATPAQEQHLKTNQEKDVVSNWTVRRYIFAFSKNMQAPQTTAPNVALFLSVCIVCTLTACHALHHRHEQEQQSFMHL